MLPVDPSSDQRIRALTDRAFAALEARPGFLCRPVQRKMADFIIGCRQVGDHGIVEAPTGVGKSLAALIPALARVVVCDERLIVATYTNVLAEQYWQKDLPLAIELLGDDGKRLTSELIMGKSRYACRERVAGEEVAQHKRSIRTMVSEFVAFAVRGTETEFAAFARARGVSADDARMVWPAVNVPPICSQRSCRDFVRCFYFNTRRSAGQADVVVTNHSVVLADAEMRQLTDGESSMLDEYDSLILDEAHDFPDSVRGAMEFSLDSAATTNLARMAAQLISSVRDALGASFGGLTTAGPFPALDAQLATELASVEFELESALRLVVQSAIVAVSPPELMQHEAVRRTSRADLAPRFQELVDRLRTVIESFLSSLKTDLANYRTEGLPELLIEARELVNQHSWWFRKFVGGLKLLMAPETGVTWIDRSRKDQPALKTVPLEFASLLKERLWRGCPVIAMSATLAIDGSFAFFQTQTGLQESTATLQLEPVFDWSNQAALYLPPQGRMVEPPTGAAAGNAHRYYRQVAEEIERIIAATKGRALVLFSSRAEMEAVREQMNDRPGIQVLVQGRSGHADLSKRFIEDRTAVLFGLRSFWTGFDAPGETLSCVTLVRIPFEVPTEPPQIARGALIEFNGRNPFTEWTLPNTKQQIKQGAGRLLRRADDFGVICLLDARIYTRRYGREILANLPDGLRYYHDIGEAVNAAGI